jgi:hypothetical protein
MDGAAEERTAALALRWRASGPCGSGSGSGGGEPAYTERGSESDCIECEERDGVEAVAEAEEDEACSEEKDAGDKGDIISGLSVKSGRTPQTERVWIHGSGRPWRRY